MSKNEFDDLLRKKFEEEHFAYNKKQWEQFSGQLPPVLKKDRKHLPLTITLGIAAALALLLASVLLVKFISRTSPETNILQTQSVSKAMQQAGAAEDARHTDKKTFAGNIAAHKEKTASGISPRAATKPFPAAQPAESNFKDSDAATAYLGNRPYQNKPQVASFLKEAPHSKATELAHKKITSTVNAINGNPGPPPPLYPDLSHPLRIRGFGNTAASNVQARHEKDAPQTLLAIGGGMNYGSLNAGYSIGFTAKHSLGSDFFVEGTVAMMYNNNVNNSGDYFGPPANTASRPAAFYAQNPTLSTSFAPSQDLYYLQFNPAFGYEIGEKLSFSLGGDMQQMISGDNHTEKIQMFSDGLRRFPVMDFGITAKTEFAVAPHIQAGMAFREGLNNFLTNNPVKYVNRRYFEVQFKYAIPVQ